MDLLLSKLYILNSAIYTTCQALKKKKKGPKFDFFHAQGKGVQDAGEQPWIKKSLNYQPNFLKSETNKQTQTTFCSFL